MNWPDNSEPDYERVETVKQDKLSTPFFNLSCIHPHIQKVLCAYIITYINRNVPNCFNNACLIHNL